MHPSQDPPSPAHQTARVPGPAEVEEVVGYVPLLAAFFHRARADMPPAMRAAFERHGLGPRHGAVLVQLSAGRPLGVTALAKRLGCSLSTASQLVGELQRAGLAHREEDPDDRRRTLVSVPDRPREEFAHFLALRAGPLLAALDRLSPEHREGFVTGLRLWAEETRHTDPA